MSDTNYEKKQGKGSKEKSPKCKQVWYVAYGSNLCKKRFMVYIDGGSCPENGKEYEGCANKTPPLDDKPVLIPHELYFGGSSTSWEKKGTAFIDANKFGITLSRAYLITEEQFLDIQKQEGSSYKHIVELKNGDGEIPYKTFTSETRQPENEPSTGYKSVIIKGLSETYPQLPILYGTELRE